MGSWSIEKLNQLQSLMFWTWMGCVGISFAALPVIWFT